MRWKCRHRSGLCLAGVDANALRARQVLALVA